MSPLFLHILVCYTEPFLAETCNHAFTMRNPHTLEAEAYGSEQECKVNGRNISREFKDTVKKVNQSRETVTFRHLCHTESVYANIER